MKTHSDDCFTAMTGLEPVLERLQWANSSLRGLVRYNDQRLRIERCPNSGGQLAERAYQAESDLRIVLKAGLDSLNELADSGKLRSIFSPESLQPKKPVAFLKAFEGIKQFFSDQKELSGFDTSFLDETAKVFKMHEIAAEWTGTSLAIRFKDASGKVHTHQMDGVPRPGDLGRIGAKQFFSTERGVVFTPMIAALGDEDCHHENQTLTDFSHPAPVARTEREEKAVTSGRAQDLVQDRAGTPI
jgi:hypothetical protein